MWSLEFNKLKAKKIYEDVKHAKPTKQWSCFSVAALCTIESCAKAPYFPPGQLVETIQAHFSTYQYIILVLFFIAKLVQMKT